MGKEDSKRKTIKINDKRSKERKEEEQGREQKNNCVLLKKQPS